ncbi:ABC transporter substrate-binding protein [Pararoseomonas indoligenes]|uniref:ABC transporter substrate-binding protein n=1 Tax=Roseomonas indoligenes TaxID=2820811 RepID=A0A940N2T4_9PROT|nr:ABC transporter substrate-binding protein [Pararoseomonas indoligenes]MBP0495720.1 ABC transporter substrate-binding protein [Pararoseomonas indoligenes]
MLNRKQFLQGALGALLAPTVSRTAAAQTTAIRCVLNWSLAGDTAPFFLAADRGYFAEEKLEVTLDTSNGSGDAVTRVASGAYQMGVADVATLVDFAVRQPQVAPRTVMMLFDRSPQAIMAMKRSGITKLSDLPGHVMGVGTSDGASRLFPALLRKNGLDINRIEKKSITPPLREPMLITGQVDAACAYDFTSWFNLKARGVKREDVSILYYADNGLDLYGNSIIAGRPILESNPEAVRRFTRAAAKGWRDAMAEPAAAAAVLKKRSALIDIAIETERVTWIRDNEVRTPYTLQNGIGRIDPQRLRSDIATLVGGFGLSTTPALETIYDDRFLPDIADRVIRAD